MSNETGGFRVYVQEFPQGHSRRHIYDDLGAYPARPRNGHDLLFLSRGLLMAAAYQVRGYSFVAEKPRIWFGKKIVSFSATMGFDPAPDGKHVVALLPADTPGEPHDRVIFLLNFFDELRRRVPSSSN